jgi:hypothetical protein
MKALNAALRLEFTYVNEPEASSIFIDFLLLPARSETIDCLNS